MEVESWSGHGIQETILSPEHGGWSDNRGCGECFAHRNFTESLMLKMKVKKDTFDA